MGARLPKHYQITQISPILFNSLYVFKKRGSLHTDSGVKGAATFAVISEPQRIQAFDSAETDTLTWLDCGPLRLVPRI